MFWRDTELSCWWYRAPIETQAMMIEAFDEVMNDAEGGRGLQGLAAQAEADAGLEDDEGHRRRGLRPAPPRRQPAEVRRAGRGDARRAGRSSRRRSRPAPASTSRSSSAARCKPEMGNDHGEEDRRRRELGQRPLAVPGGHQQGDAARRHAAEAGEEALQADATRRRARCSKPVKGPVDGRRRAGGAGRAADRPRHGVRPPEGPPRQRHGAGERAVAVQVPGRPGLLRDRRRTRRATSSSTTCRRGRTCSSTRSACSTRGKYPTGLRTSSACTPRSSTATRRASTLEVK